MESGFNFSTCVEWIWCVHGRSLFTLSICGTLWVVWCTNTALARAAADLEHCVPMDTLQSLQWGLCRGDFNMACGQRIRLLLTFFSLRLNSMPTLRCWSRSSNFPEFAGRCLDAFASHHSCLSPWPPSAVLSFPTSSPSDDTGPPIPTLQVQRGVTEHSLVWTALPGHPSPRPECNNRRQG